MQKIQNYTKQHPGVLENVIYQGLSRYEVYRMRGWIHNKAKKNED